MQDQPDDRIKTACAVMDGSDQRLLHWITESGIAADNLAVESPMPLDIPDVLLGP